MSIMGQSLKDITRLFASLQRGLVLITTVTLLAGIYMSAGGMSVNMANQTSDNVYLLSMHTRISMAIMSNAKKNIYGLNIC